MTTQATAAVLSPQTAASVAAPAAGTTPPASGAPASAPGTGQPAASNAPWYGTIEQPELSTWVTNKAFKSPLEALESSYNLEKLVGAPADQILRLPQKPDDKAAWDSVWNRLGRPEKPDGYELPVPEGMDKAFSQTASAWFHEMGIPKAAAQGITNKWNAYMAEEMKKYAEADAAKFQQEQKTLEQEWGANYKANELLVERAWQKFAPQAGMDAQDLEKIRGAVGTAKLSKFLHQFGALDAEPNFVSGEGQKFTMTKDQATAKRDQLMNDKDYAKAYFGGDKNKVAEITRLSEIIAGELVPDQFMNQRR